MFAHKAHKYVSWKDCSFIIHLQTSLLSNNKQLFSEKYLNTSVSLPTHIFMNFQKREKEENFGRTTTEH